MNKRLIVTLVLALAVLAFGVTAAPALADYPITGVPGTAYVHPWWGTDPVIWEECDGTGIDANWYLWSAAEPALPDSPYKVIPAGYDVQFVGFDIGIPRGQMAAMPGNLLLAFTLDKAGGLPQGLPQSMTAKEAKSFWGEVVAWPDWLMPTTSKEGGAQVWTIAWMYDLGQLPGGTYSGQATWSMKHPQIDVIVWDEPPGDEPWPRTPTHFPATAPYTGPYSFTVAYPAP